MNFTLKLQVSFTHALIQITVKDENHLNTFDIFDTPKWRPVPPPIPKILSPPPYGGFGIPIPKNFCVLHTYLFGLLPLF